LEQSVDKTHRGQSNRTDRQPDDGEPGIGDQDGLDELMIVFVCVLIFATRGWLYGLAWVVTELFGFL